MEQLISRDQIKINRFLSFVLMVFLTVNSVVEGMKDGFIPSFTSVTYLVNFFIMLLQVVLHFNYIKKSIFPRFFMFYLAGVVNFAVFTGMFADPTLYNYLFLFVVWSLVLLYTDVTLAVIVFAVQMVLHNIALFTFTKQLIGSENGADIVYPNMILVVIFVLAISAINMRKVNYSMMMEAEERVRNEQVKVEQMLQQSATQNGSLVQLNDSIQERLQQLNDMAREYSAVFEEMNGSFINNVSRTDAMHAAGSESIENIQAIVQDVDQMGDRSETQTATIQSSVLLMDCTKEKMNFLVKSTDDTKLSMIHASDANRKMEETLQKIKGVYGQI
ncbi:MAG: hypothetical protein ACRCWQ_14935, partial [Bacilli bacterium]